MRLPANVVPFTRNAAPSKRPAAKPAGRPEAAPAALRALAVRPIAEKLEALRVAHPTGHALVELLVDRYLWELGA